MSETFEVLVRPNVVPAFRPQFTISIPPLPDPEQGKFVITGSSGQAVVLTKSEQGSWSRSMPVETERTVTRQRVYQKKPPTPEHPEGEIEKENFVDVEHVTKMTTRAGDGTSQTTYYLKPGEAPNIETLEVNVRVPNPDVPPEGGGEE